MYKDDVKQLLNACIDEHFNDVYVETISSWKLEITEKYTYEIVATVSDKSEPDTECFSFAKFVLELSKPLKEFNIFKDKEFTVKLKHIETNANYPTNKIEIF